jgi:sensor histidine kinase YesM
MFCVELLGRVPRNYKIVPRQKHVQQREEAVCIDYSIQIGYSMFRRFRVQISSRGLLVIYIVPQSIQIFYLKMCLNQFQFLSNELLYVWYACSLFGWKYFVKCKTNYHYTSENSGYSLLGYNVE